jgi:hypothetical protein
MVEGHMPLGRAGSIPAQRIKKNRHQAVFCVNEVLYESSAGFSFATEKTIVIMIGEVVSSCVKIL